MTNIKDDLGTLYHPVSALVCYQTKSNHKDTYVEYFDMDEAGSPINAHPLTTREAKALAIALNTDKEESHAFLKPTGILTTNVLHIDPSENGKVLWFTKARIQQLYLSESLEIPSGKAAVPALLWHASKQTLAVFALASNRRPTENTTLYHAPFFNVYYDGDVCMGTVDVCIKKSASLEEFIQAWESYFFNSYFSHLINDHNPVKGNCVNLWKNLVETGSPFPKEVLKPANTTFKNLLP
ncbi:prokaryotic E2 ligase family D protein [Pinibacter aurantiacus]|uniref:Prokaryotic E2 ligase family D protein n=1 Tax=Pinibacter aurantiacus TaxID=2851599 RepID=A0A9E2S723_9BACT|nr:prokaryotic E2 ligase family D protein [Pinibacter aurantiacus]MBV4357351.1 prokaryotic E2 ligase family D protein [Pinibacter aurantiacus]